MTFKLILTDVFLSMIHEIHFTLAQAKMKLTEILNDLHRIVFLKKQLDSKGFDVYRHRYFGGRGPNGTGEFPKEMEELVLIVKRITEQGVQIKSLDDGLIDFPHIRNNGEEVYLCYKLGEETIAYWHGIEDGFAGRKGINTL